MEAHKLHAMAESAVSIKAADELKNLLIMKDSLLTTCTQYAQNGNFEFKFNATSNNWAEHFLPKIKTLLEDQGFSVSLINENRKDSWGQPRKETFILVQW